MPQPAQAPPSAPWNFSGIPDASPSAPTAAAAPKEEQYNFSGIPDATPAAASKPADQSSSLISSIVDHILPHLSTAGGAVGGIVGGVPGAALGGAAGRGYTELLTHLSELPGAFREVAKHMLDQPRATLGGFAQGAGEGLLHAGTDAAVQGGAQAIGTGLGALASKAAPALMQSAVKPGVRATAAALRRGSSSLPVVQTLLDEGVNVSRAGIAKLSSVIDSSNAAITDALNNVPATTRIPGHLVTDRLAPVIQRFTQQVNPAADIATIKQAGGEFLAHPTLQAGGGGLSVLDAQAIKQGTYAQLKDRAYAASTGGAALKRADVEAQKALARGLKEEIANEALKAGVDVGALNAREGAAMTAREAIAHRLAQAGNRDPAGLAWLAHSPVTAMLYLAERSPGVKSLIARGMYDQAGKIAGISPQLIRAAVVGMVDRPDEEEGGEGAPPNAPAPATAPVPSPAALVAPAAPPHALAAPMGAPPTIETPPAGAPAAPTGPPAAPPRPVAQTLRDTLSHGIAYMTQQSGAPPSVFDLLDNIHDTTAGLREAQATQGENFPPDLASLLQVLPG